MPNWCSNGITLRHADPAMIDRVIKGQEGLLMEFLPTPQELLDTVAGFVGEDKQAAHEAQIARNLEKYGHTDWYNWNIANWGTKWDFNLESVERVDANTVTGSFESAWAPPTTAYERLMDLGFEITAFYYEPGMAFVGKWEDGYDDYFEYGGYDSTTVRDHIGDELDDYFGISESMAEWEAENAEEEE
jgi:hypothetical protein